MLHVLKITYFRLLNRFLKYKIFIFQSYNLFNEFEKLYMLLLVNYHIKFFYLNHLKFHMHLIFFKIYHLFDYYFYPFVIYNTG